MNDLDAVGRPAQPTQCPDCNVWFGVNEVVGKGCPSNPGTCPYSPTGKSVRTKVTRIKATMPTECSQCEFTYDEGAILGQGCDNDECPFAPIDAGSSSNPHPSEQRFLPTFSDHFLEALRTAGETYEERRKVYGEGFKKHGKALNALFPEGLILKSEEDFTRFVLFMMSWVKLQRYSENLMKGGHPDSSLDLGVYSFMLSAYDKEQSQ